MFRLNRESQNTAEIMVQYSSAVIHMTDPKFQNTRIFERSVRAISNNDLAFLRQMSIGTSAVAFSTAILLIIVVAISALNRWLSFLPEIKCAYFDQNQLISAVGVVYLYVLWKRRYVLLSLWTQLKQALLSYSVIGVSKEGVSMYHKPCLCCFDRHFPWETVTNICIVHDFPAEEKAEKEAMIEITSSEAKPVRLSLKAIRSIEERKLLVDAFKTYARRAIDVNDISRMVRASDVQDIAFTQLWSDALRSSLPRNLSSVLQPETLLQEGRFFIEKQIGGGGQGAIYLAEMLDVADQKTKVALKEYVLPDQEHLFDRKRAIEQFEREVHLLARLKHKNLANLVDAFIEDHRAYLVLEYLDGPNLRDTIKLSGKLSNESFCAISLQLCEVLNYLHSFNPPVVHLDVSPENAIVLADGTAKLIDFNTSSDGSGLRTKLIAGKQRYMPPEQYRNEASPQCDIYSLGCTMFFMLTGIEPEPLTVLHPIASVSSIPLILDSIVSEATRLDKETRTQTIEAVKDKLLTLRPLPLTVSGALDQHAA